MLELAPRTVPTTPVVSIRLPIAVGVATCHLFEFGGDGAVIVLEFGARELSAVPLVRVHSGCATGDLFGSLRCDCGSQLRQSLELLAAARWGLLAYVPAHEGRGIGLKEKLRSYVLQDEGLDTFEANVALGHEHDERRYDDVATALGSLGVSAVRLLTRNPLKAASLRACGIDVRETSPLDVPTNDHNAGYLASKFLWFLDQ